MLFCVIKKSIYFLYTFFHPLKIRPNLKPLDLNFLAVGLDMVMIDFIGNHHFFFQIEVGVLTQIQEECPPFCTLWTSCFDKPNGHNYAASMHGH